MQNNIIAPKIIFVNHASYILEYKKVCLLVDPWLSGTIFNNGWAHVSPTYFPKELANKITHIWFSHEHPDHFSPNDLKKIKEKCQTLPKIIFQKTKDKRVKKFCEKLGFEVNEISSWHKLNIDKNFSITVISHGRIDSASIVEVGGYTIVNKNDCVLNEKDLASLSKKYKNCDILLTQFSYASWIGNPNETTKRKEAILNKEHELTQEVQKLQPKYIIPFASFIYFCHEENHYMNYEIADLNNIIKLTKFAGTRPVVLYPGDEWDLSNVGPTNDLSISKYKKDFNNINKKNFIKSNSIEYNKFREYSKLYFKKIKKKNGTLLMLGVCLISKLSGILFTNDPLEGYSRIIIKVIDYKKIYKFDWISGLVEVSANNNIDVEISSESLSYVFKYEWGIDTLIVNGRAISLKDNTIDKLRRVFCLGAFNSVGKNLASAIYGKFFNKQGNYERIHDTDVSYLNIESKK